jgi:hypothetical protein
MSFWERIKEAQRKSLLQIAQTSNAAKFASKSDANVAKQQSISIGAGVAAAADTPPHLTIQALFARYSRLVSEMGWVIQRAVVYSNPTAFQNYTTQLDKLITDIEKKMQILRSKDLKQEFMSMQQRLQRLKQFVSAISKLR